MKDLRTYGCTPFSVALIHGGPGAAGEMAPVARELSRFRGILEPFQTKRTVSGQIQELDDILRDHGNTPLTLIGHSWGAWLSLMYAAHHQLSMKKLILVNSGPFEERYVSQIAATRMSRMNDEEKRRFQTLIAVLEDPHGERKDAVFSEVGSLLFHTDSYNPCTPIEPDIRADYHIFQHVWNEADAMRRSGKLLAFARRVRCPVVAIHGAYDPHPYEGVERPLSNIIREFTFILLQHCGHYPWMERDAKKEFYAVLEKELQK
ncbi:MAG TPA: alpha/beta hydrolase [Candidatus Thermoplasmatota archaeon]|nr:alpha/beta hydrolase [Candidatus Thermoplasmatota archaeon]